MKTHTTVKDFSHQGKSYKAGDKVELNPEEAAKHVSEGNLRLDEPKA